LVIPLILRILHKYQKLRPEHLSYSLTKTDNMKSKVNYLNIYQDEDRSNDRAIESAAKLGIYGVLLLTILISLF